MSASRLFLRRLLDEWKFQFRVVRTIIDWTVALYLIVPGIVIFSFIYRSWWLEVPEWIQPIPIGAVFLLFYFIVWMGHFRTFVLEADKLFLVKHTELFLQLKRCGFIYSLWLHASIIGGAILVILPFLVQGYGLNVKQVITLFVMFTIINWLVMALKREILKVENRLFQRFVTSAVFMGIGLLLLIFYPLWLGEHLLLLFVILTVLFILTVFIYRPYVTVQSKLETNLMIESLERTKYINLILNFSQEVEKTNVITRKNPWLFPKSQRIFTKRIPKTSFLELFSKVFIRNPQYMAGFFQLIGVSTAAIIFIPPWWIKITIFFGALFFLSIWADLLWKKIVVSHPLTKKYGEQDEYYSAKKIATRFLVIVAAMLLISPLIASMMLQHIFGGILS